MQDAQPKKWIKSPQNMRLSVPYIRATVLKSTQKGRAEYSLETQRGPICVQLPINQSFDISDGDEYADMCDMNVLNQPQVLNNILRRYQKDQIFTSIGPTLIVVNPYRVIDKLFKKQILQSIQEKIVNNKLEKYQPHVYVIAGKAYLALKETGIKQAIVISGQSGAGKTQSTKYCMQLLTSLGDRKNYLIQDKILACNPVLEAFGNSKTVRNQNSSRFGKYVKIYFNSDYIIKGANINSYLLEKSRVVLTAKNQRTFHSFYALIASKKYGMKDFKDYQLLRQSNCYESTHINDAKYFQQINKAFHSIGFQSEEIKRIWKLIGCILKLGNLNFDQIHHLLDESKPCKIKDTHQLQEISSILKTEPAHLQKILVYQRKKFFKQYTLSPYNYQNCKSNLHTFCKAIYNAVFLFIIHKIKLSLAPPQSSKQLKQINILDIFGFENFQQNSFQQFCINFTNEKLLKLYNNYIFQREMEILREDGLQQQILGILPPTNDQIISIISSSKVSLFSIINDMTLPQFKDQDIIQGFRRIEHPSLIFNKIDKLKFRIIHTQATVDYSIADFKKKNQDKINDQIMEIVTKLIPNSTMKDQVGKTILSKFNKQIDDLMHELNTSSVHFIRCIKPNQSKTPFSPNEKYILTQIRYLGIFQTIMVRKNTFPYRKFYKDFKKQFALMFPQVKKQKNQKIVTKLIIQSLTNNKSSYLLGNQRLYVSSELQQILNRQIYKFLALRTSKIKLIQRALKRCMYRRKILMNLHLLYFRIELWKKIPHQLQCKLMTIAMETLKTHSIRVKKNEEKRRQQEYLIKMRELKKQREQEQSLQSKQHQKKEAAERIYMKMNQIVNQQSFQYLNQSFSNLKNTSNRYKVHKPSLSIHQPFSNMLQNLNTTGFVGDSAIQNITPYYKPQTPSSQLIGRSQVFNQSIFEQMQTSNDYQSKKDHNILFQGYLTLQPFQKYPNPNLNRLKNILSQKYQVKIQGNQQDFFSPLSSNSFFKIQQLPPQQLNQILDFPAESYFNKILRKRTTFLGSKKTYQQILVYKKSSLSKSMTVMESQQDQKRAINIFNTILLIGDQPKIESVLLHIQALMEQSQSSSMQLKNQILVQLIRQSNSNYQLVSIRNYQAMAVFLHVYNPSEQLLRAALNMYYWKFQKKKMGVSQKEYLQYIFSIMLRKIRKKGIIGYLPISYQIMGLMCKRQISTAVYLPIGNSILIKVQPYSTFADIKSLCMAGFGINPHRYSEQLFTFYQVVNFQHQELQQTPIRQTNMVWDILTYWQLTKIKYAQSQIKPPNFFLMFKIRYVFQCSIDDQESIQLYFSQLYFDYFMGRIKLEEKYMLMLASIIKISKYDCKPINQIYIAVLPIWFSKTHNKEQCVKEINCITQQLKKNKFSELELKYKFVEICEKSELALANIIPTQTNEGEVSLFFKNKSIILVNGEDKAEIIPLKKLIKWSIDKQFFYFQVNDKQINRPYRVRTDFASICNEYLKNIPISKQKPFDRNKSLFLKK